MLGGRWAGYPASVLTRLAPVQAAFVLLLLALVASAARAEEELEEIELVPDERAGIGPANFFAPVTGFFMGGPSYWYSPRRITVRTTPPAVALTAPTSTYFVSIASVSISLIPPAPANLELATVRCH